MRISGFTFARNAVRLDYPLREVIESALPLVDEFIVNVGVPDGDGTLDLVRQVADPRVKIVESQWNPNIDTGGYVLAQQTNIALFNCTGEWAVYLQSDEFIHERHHAHLTDLMTKYLRNDGVDGISCERVHFHGDYHTVRKPYSRDLVCRIVKPHRFVLSRGDAAGFCVHPRYKEAGRRIRVVESEAPVLHYGLVVARRVDQMRRAMIDELWHAGQENRRAGEPRSAPSGGTSDDVIDQLYQSCPREGVEPYAGEHPAAMQPRIAADPFRLDLDSPRWRTQLTRPERAAKLKARIESLYPPALRRRLLRRDCVFVKG